MTGFRRVAAGAVALGALMGLVLQGTAVAQDSGSPSAASSASTTATKDVFNIGVDSDITSLNPFKLCCGPDYEYLELVYDLGFTYNQADLSAAPQIVQSWTPNADSTEYTLKIVQGAMWHDGQPLTADDVAWTFNFVSKYGMPFYKDYFPFNATFEVTAPDTVLWKSEEPTFAPNVPAYMPILPEHIWGEFDTVDGTPTTAEAAEVRKATKEFANDPPIGSGPFTFVSWDEGQNLKFEVNPNYWGGQPAAIDEVNIRVFGNQEAMVQALKAGQIDFAEGITANLFNSIKDEPNITTHVADGGCWGNLAWNFGGQTPRATNDPVIKDLAFRQAVAYAINKQEIADKVYLGTAVVGDSILMPGKNGRWYHDIPTDLEYPYNPDQAKQVLEDNGYVDSDGDGIRENPDTGEDISLEFMVLTDLDGSVETGKFLQGYLKDVGIDVTFITVNTNKAYDLWYTGEWDAYVWDWCPDPDPDFMLSVFTTNQCLGWSDGCFSDPAYDKLYEQQRSQLDLADRKATIDKMQEMIAEELPTMVLNYESDLQAYRNDRWQGYKLWPDTEAGLLMFGYGSRENYFELTPVSEGSATTTSEGLPGWVWVAVAGGVVVIAGAVALARRGRREDEI
jgi:peptide/nickel transport system substrate-binding protein